MTVKWVFMPASGGDSVGMAQRADKTNGWGESEGRTLRLTQRKYHGGWGGGVTTKYLEEGNSVCFMTEDRKPFDSERIGD